MIHRLFSHRRPDSFYAKKPLKKFPGLTPARRCIARRQQKTQPTMIYVHPWELDPDQPRLPVGRLSQWRHRVNLHKTEAKLERLLRTFRFDTAESVLARVCSGRTLPVFALTPRD